MGRVGFKGATVGWVHNHDIQILCTIVQGYFLYIITLQGHSDCVSVCVG